MSTTPTTADTLTDPTRRRTKGSSRPRRIGRWVIVVAVLAIVATIALAVRMFGHVEGREFSPESFRHRDFELYEVPYLEVQISPIQRSIRSTDTATYLRQKGLVTNIPAKSGDSTADPTWHLVRLTRGLRGSTHRDAKILTEQLDLQIVGDHYWKKWSVDHPKKAKVFWPVIQRLALRELYVLMPGLFEIAQREMSATELTETLDDRLQSDYRGLIADAKADGRDDLVDLFTEEFRTDFPDQSL